MEHSRIDRQTQADIQIQKDPNSCQKHETLQGQGQGTDQPQAG
jgi:hypothetical protein